MSDFPSSEKPSSEIPSSENRKTAHIRSYTFAISFPMGFAISYSQKGRIFHIAYKRVFHRNLVIHMERKMYISPRFTDTNNTICNLRRNVYMKATGIVRRIDARGIITQKS